MCHVYGGGRTVVSVGGASEGHLLIHLVCMCLGTGWEDNCVDSLAWCLPKLKYVIEWKVGG